MNNAFSDWHITDFKADYSKFKLDSLLRDTILQNGANAKRLCALVSRVEELQTQIEKLKFDVEADTAYIAANFLKEMIFPRFNGYSEFLRSDYYRYTDDCGYVRFSVLMKKFVNGELKSEEDIKYAESRLSDFVWLFFLGAGMYEEDYIVDLDKIESTVGDYVYSATEDYMFSVLVPNTKKSYQVKFRFFDLEQSMNNARLYTTVSQHRSDEGEYCSIRNCDFGKIEVTLQKKLHGFNDYELPDGKQSYTDDGLSLHRLCIKSFDPIEIAAWLHSLFSSDSESHEIDILEKKE